MKIVIFFILIISLAGCKDKDGLPGGILKKDKMRAVLWDVLQAESYTTQFIKKDSAKNTLLENAKLQQQIFAIHKITKEDFYDSYVYYKDHVELMRVLLDSITASAEREKYKVLYNQPVIVVADIPVRIPFAPLPIKPSYIPMPIPTVIFNNLTKKLGR